MPSVVSLCLKLCDNCCNYDMFLWLTCRYMTDDIYVRGTCVAVRLVVLLKYVLHV